MGVGPLASLLDYDLYRCLLSFASQVVRDYTEFMGLKSTRDKTFGTTRDQERLTKSYQEPDIQR